MGKFALRGLAQSMARELSPQGLHVAHFVIDGGIRSGVRSEPARYRRGQPIWTDASFASWSTAVRSPALLAAVRSATVGSPIDESCCAPFMQGR